MLIALTESSAVAYLVVLFISYRFYLVLDKECLNSTFRGYNDLGDNSTGILQGSAKLEKCLYLCSTRFNLKLLRIWSSVVCRLPTHVGEETFGGCFSFKVLRGPLLTVHLCDVCAGQVFN
jgi:hypothetical protein